MPVDVLKMDRGFILNIEHNEQDFRLVELILEIARNLKMPVIAEGVETEKQITLLKNAGCDLVQGYYFSRPVPPEEFDEWKRVAEKEIGFSCAVCGPLVRSSYHASEAFSSSKEQGV